MGENLREELKKCEEELKNKQDNIKKLESYVENTKSTKVSKFGTILLYGQTETYPKELRDLISREKEIKANIEKNKQEIVSLQERRKSLDSKISGLESKKIRLISEIKKMNLKLQQLKEEQENKKNELQKMQEEQKKYDDIISKYQKERPALILNVAEELWPADLKEAYKQKRKILSEIKKYNDEDKNEQIDSLESEIKNSTKELNEVKASLGIEIVIEKNNTDNESENNNENNKKENTDKPEVKNGKEPDNELSTSEPSKKIEEDLKGYSEKLVEGFKPGNNDKKTLLQKFKLLCINLWNTIKNKVEKLYKNVKKAFPQKQVKAITAPNETKKNESNLRKNVEVDIETKEKGEEVMKQHKLNNNIEIDQDTQMLIDMLGDREK